MYRFKSLHLLTAYRHSGPMQHVEQAYRGYQADLLGMGEARRCCAKTEGPVQAQGKHLVPLLISKRLAALLNPPRGRSSRVPDVHSTRSLFWLPGKSLACWMHVHRRQPTPLTELRATANALQLSHRPS